MTDDILPTGWCSARLGEVVEILDRMRIPVNSQERSGRLGDIPYYGATGQVGWIDDFIFDEELVLLGEDGAPFLDPTKPKAYLIQGKSWVNNHAHVLRGYSGVSNKFLMYQLNCLDYGSFVSGTTRLKLPQGPMALMPFLLAPEPEQRRIVEAIEEQFTRLDAAVAGLKRTQANLKRYRAAVLKAACEGRLVPTEAELARAEVREYEPADRLLARILEERRTRWEIDQFARMQPTGRLPKGDASKARYVEPARPQLDNLPKLPEGWAWASVEQLAQVETGATPLRGCSDYYLGGTVPWVTSGALNEPFVDEASEYITELALRETNAKVFPARTLLVAMYGEGKTRGKVSELRFNAATNQACAGLVFSGTAELARRYTKLFFEENYLKLRALAAGGAQPNLNCPSSSRPPYLFRRWPNKSAS